MSYYSKMKPGGYPTLMPHAGDDESMQNHIQGVAETIFMMVKGGSPLDMAMDIIEPRTPHFKKYKSEILAKVLKMLENHGIPVEDRVRKMGFAQPVPKPDYAALKESEDSENLVEVNNGDLVAFNIQEKYYILDKDYSDSYYWVTPHRKDRFQTEAEGFPVYKPSAKFIIERGEMILEGDEEASDEDCEDCEE